MKQAPPDIVDTSVDLHRISLQGKLERDWVQKNAVYIDRWAHRGEHLTDALTLDGDTTYLAAYMESYRRTTRRLPSVQPPEEYAGSFGELSRVALENACAMAIEASTKAIGRGGGGCGSGGRGRSGGHGGGHGDEDDLGNFQL
ncbi:hypothetical protein SO802_017462 [Lithocarpus litseifolius]|uniref:Uncharacterized protein n=1 Tax=Lithocarpus litseifolius TaxID=425828 RepID=A0AAW2CKW5_9ROSI